MMRKKKKGKGPDLAQMRQQLAKLGVNIVCLRPSWMASGPGDYIMVRDTLRQVVQDSYKNLIQEK
jgi:hypothetical protein